MKYKGTYEELKNIISGLPSTGEWKGLPNGQKQFKYKLGGNFSWYETKGTMVFGGSSEDKNVLEKQVNALLKESGDLVQSRSGTVNKKVFVVYGHDKVSRDQLEALLRKWKLEPLILDDLPSRGQTIIEKLEEYTEDVGFAVVLATPDDVGYRVDREDEKMKRVRQNVVLELGMLLTKLGRKKVAILLKNQKYIEKPSDIDGLIYIPFENDIREEAGKHLAKEMNESGYKISVADL